MDPTEDLTYSCPYCGQENSILVDRSGGKSQLMVTEAKGVKSLFDFLLSGVRDALFAYPTENGKIMTEQFEQVGRMISAALNDFGVMRHNG